MKKVLLAIGLICATGLVQAQYYTISSVGAGENPGNLNQEDTEYPLGGGMAAGWTQIIGGSQATPVWSPVQTLPFAFDFNGSAVTEYKVSSSGVLTFATSAVTPPAYGSVALPAAGVPDSSVCILGIDATGSSDVAVTKTFGSAPNRQHWIFFSSYTSPGTDWTYWSIVLEETSNNIYIVDQRTNVSVALSLGIQIDGSTAISVAGSPSVPSYTSNLPTRDDNSYYSFFPGTPPDYDVNHLYLSLPQYVEDGNDFDVSGRIMNMGSQTITSMTVEYTVDGGSVVTDNLTGLNIAFGETFDYTLPTAWTAVKGTSALIEVQNVEATVTMINSNMDSNPSNNVADADISVHGPAVQRKPLLEQFTSSTCPPCVPGNINVLDVMSNYPGEFSKVNYQMSWPGNGDPYYTDEGGVRQAYYGVNSVPSMHSDGSLGLNSNNYTEAIFESYQNIPSFVNLSVTGTIQPQVTYEVIGGQLIGSETEYVLTATTHISPITDLPAGLIAHISLQEDLTFNNVETNGETEFHDVMKKMLPNANGTTLPAISTNDTFSITQTHTFNSVYRLPNNANDPINHAIEHSIEEWDDLRLATWVQTGGTAVVWQSENAEVELLELIDNLETEVNEDGDTIYIVDGERHEMFGNSIVPQGTEDVFGATVTVFPNPAQDVLNVAGVSSNATATMFDAMGRMVRSQAISNNGVQVSDLDAGVYNMVIEDNGQQTTKRITIVH